MFDTNNFCNAIQYSGDTSGYTRMNPVYNAILSGNNNCFGGCYGNYGNGCYPYSGNIFTNTNINYSQGADGSVNYSYNQGPDKLMLGLGAANNVIGSIGNILIARDQEKQQQAYQAAQYQAYQQQAAQLAQEQQRQQSQANMMSMFQTMMTMKMMDNPDFFNKMMKG